jgi:AcrR family transcriptional regulator
MSPDRIGAERPSPGNDVGRLRADARLNRARILAAARDVFVEQGPGASLEEISRRAGTGIATLYRRFPDRHALMRAVVLEALERTAEEARAALDEQPDPLAALTRYMHAALDSRIAAVIPVLAEEIALGEDDEMLRAREASTRPIQDLINAAQRAGALRPDVTFGDIGMLIVRLSRPLPGTFTREINDRLAHRHLDLLISGFRPGADRAAEALTGPALTLGDVRGLQAQGRARRSRR